MARGRYARVMRLVSTRAELERAYALRSRAAAAGAQAGAASVAGSSSGACVLVPTMGALHAGHAALVSHAAQLAAGLPGVPPVVVTIFVNPTQFNDPRDLARYPRTIEADVRLCQEAMNDALGGLTDRSAANAAGAGGGGGGAASRPELLVFAPMNEEVYPPGETIGVPELPPVATQPGLEDARRPGHFAGVCQVVSRLFDLTNPSRAIFGEKDWQQLQVIKAMAAAQRRPIEIVPYPTIREEGATRGLAMSSRNVFLSHEERMRACVISSALCEASSERTPEDAEQLMEMMISRAGLEVEYAVVRDAETLMPIGPSAARSGKAGACRALVAARLSGVRLIDNAPWTPA